MRNESPDIQSSDFMRLCKTVIVFRAILVGVALSIIAFLMGAGIHVRGGIPVGGLLLVVFPLTAIWWIALKSNLSLRKLVYSQVVADLAIETGIIFYTGGATSQLTLLYLATIFVVSIFFYLRGAIVVASLSAALYISASLVHWRQVTLAGEAGTYDLASSYMIFHIALQVAFFYLIAFLSGHLSQRIQLSSARLKTTTSELKHARMDTNSIVESMNSGLLTVDPDGIITEMNSSAESILALVRGETRGRCIEDVIVPISPELHRKVLAAISEGREEGRGEVNALVNGGRRVPLGVSISVLKGDAGERRGAVIVFQDLTQVKEMRDKVRLSDRLAALGELSAAIAHEIRTPLASICGSIDMLRDTSLKPEDKRLMGLVVKESERLRRIIDDFLEFARSRSSQFTAVPMDSLLQEVVHLARNHPSFARGVEIRLEASPGLVGHVDEGRIKQVFFNLALNAVEAVQEGGFLEINLEGYTSSDGEDYIRVVFRDNGKGIDRNDMRKIFDPFFTTKKEGTGLGLAIASNIVGEHGGRIEIDSQKGAGTVVKVYLPVDKSGTEEPELTPIGCGHGTGAKQQTGVM
ncbi:MAG: ATP-binding protein [bacterium]|jgi:two-component system sensor histidine kinase PilS (NtrC family)